MVSSHFFGHPAHIDEIELICEQFEATLFEDFAQAPGATVDGELIGMFGAVGIRRFGAKNLTTAEGGIITIDDAAVAEYVRKHRTNTRDLTPPSRSVRMNDVEAAIGLSQFENYDRIVSSKRAITAICDQRLSDTPVELLPVQSWATDVYHAFPVLTLDGDHLAASLGEQNTGTSRLYETVLHEYEAALSVNDEYPVAERYAQEVVLFPIHRQVSDSQARTVADTVVDCCPTQ